MDLRPYMSGAPAALVNVFTAPPSYVDETRDDRGRFTPATNPAIAGLFAGRSVDDACASPGGGDDYVVLAVRTDHGVDAYLGVVTTGTDGQEEARVVASLGTTARAVPPPLSVANRVAPPLSAYATAVYDLLAAVSEWVQSGKSIADPVAAAVAEGMVYYRYPYELPPELRLLMSYHGNKFVWLTECQLVAVLSVMMGRREALATEAYALGRNPTMVTVGGRPSVTGFARSVKRSRAEAAPVAAFQPNRLDVLARRALLDSEAPIDWDSLLFGMTDPIVFGVWQRACAEGLSTPLGTARLADLPGAARAWGIEPTPMQDSNPALLCDAMAREVMMREFGERLLPSGKRIGMPALSDAERDATHRVCSSDSHRPFARFGGNLAGWTHEAFRIVRGGGVTDAESRAVLDPAFDVVSAANAAYGVAPFTLRALNIQTQVTLAVAAIRSGVRLEPHDLADAGSACAAVTPLCALLP